MNANLRRLLCRKLRTNCLLNSYSLERNMNYNNCRMYSIDWHSYGYAFIRLSDRIRNSEIINTTKENLIVAHEWTGISWSLEIALITIAFRTLIAFPLTISQQKILAKYESLKPEINLFGQRLKKEVDSVQYAINLSPIKAKLMYTFRIKQEMKRLIIRDNCHPLKASLVVWFQIPIWIILSHSIRNMSFMYPIVDQNSQLVYNQLSNEGILWFTNLTQTDPYCALPFITAFINLTIVQLHSNERLRNLKTKTRMHSIVTNIGRALSICLIPIGLQMPSSVCFYWLVSSTMGLIQNIVLRDNRFKRIIGTDRTHLNHSSDQSVDNKPTNVLTEKYK